MGSNEKKYIDFVIDYERKNNRWAKDVRKERRGYDVESRDKNGNVRYIEVKKRDFRKYKFVFLTPNEFFNFVKDENMWLYIVYPVDKKNNKWGVKELKREKVLKAVNPKVSIWFEVSLKKEVMGR